MNKITLHEQYRELREELRAMKIPLPQDESEFEALCIKVGLRQPKIFVEIGSRDGGSFWMLSSFCAPDATIISIDLPGGEMGTSQQQP